VFATLELLAKQRRELDAQEAAWLREVAAFDRSGDWQVDGFQNAASAIRNACRMNRGVAHGYVQLARKLESLPAIAAAYGAGDISRGHATVIASACTPARAEAIAAAEPELVTVACEHTPHELSGVVRYLADAIDGDGGAANDEAECAQRDLYLAETLDGRYDLRGNLDHVLGRALETALNAEMERDLQKNDSRRTPQRRADALGNLMRGALDRGEVGESHGVRPHLSAIIDLDERAGATPELVARIRDDLHTNRHLSRVTLEWLACDCELTRIVTAGHSEILDVGRATRTIPPAIWKALVARDRHCQAPGCDRPPEQCEGHHIWHWEFGGPTSLENLRLLCWHHHRQAHIEAARSRARGG